MIVKTLFVSANAAGEDRTEHRGAGRELKYS